MTSHCPGTTGPSKQQSGRATLTARTPIRRRLAMSFAASSLPISGRLPDNLQQWVQKFGEENKIPVPSVHDPDGKLTDKVKADFALGQRIGVEHTPTLWVVSNSTISQPLVEEVKDRDQLNRMIEDVLARASPSTTKAP